jgi:hypothetical protein
LTRKGGGIEVASGRSCEDPVTHAVAGITRVDHGTRDEIEVVLFQESCAVVAV